MIHPLQNGILPAWLFRRKELGCSNAVKLKETKKLFTVRLDAAVIRDIKLLSVDTGKPVSSIVAEAVGDLVPKLGRSEVVYSSKPETRKTKKGQEEPMFTGQPMLRSSGDC